MRILTILGLSHAIFGIILIVSKEKKSRADSLLVFWISILLLPFLEYFLSDFGRFHKVINRFINQSFTLLHGPLLYLYIKEILRKEDNHLVRNWKHFLIFIFFYVTLLFNPAPLMPGGSKVLLKGFHIIKYFGVVNIGVFVFYAVGALKLLSDNNRNIKETFAYRNREITLVWLYFMPLLFLVFVLTSIIVEFTYLNNYLEITFLQPLLFFFFILYLVYFGLRQRQIYKIDTVKPVSDTHSDDKQIEKLKDIMVKDKLYRNPTLSVYELAETMGITRHSVSLLLNEKLSMNFFQFVNLYRLEEVSNRIKEDIEKHYNIIELAYDSGFNSKSSFNSLFKKYYNMTPSQFRAKFIVKKV